MFVKYYGKKALMQEMLGIQTLSHI